MNTVFSTAYFPNIEYIKNIIANKSALIEVNENYIKQTYRNRCDILSANGRLNLSVPVKKVHNSKTLIKDLKISYDENWQKNHLRAIDSAYNSSAFYEFFKDYFVHFFENKYDFLIDLNNEILETVLDILEVEQDVQVTSEYFKEYENDFRYLISPKIKSKKEFKLYTQVFSEKMDFQKNLSVLDLICCEGNNAITFLSE
jgi:hypothetical protein